jgi:multicomponent Na+:H+ antiporter subunit D
MAALAVKLPLVENQGMVTLASVFFLVSFGIKAAVFPLFFWLPASYHTPPIAISSLIVGTAYQGWDLHPDQVFHPSFYNDIPLHIPFCLLFPGFTMVVGVLGAAAQIDFRRILSFHIVSQIGYMVMGLAIYTPLAIAGSNIFIMHNILVKTNLFLISGLVKETNGSYALKKLGGVYHIFLSGGFICSFCIFPYRSSAAFRFLGQVFTCSRRISGRAVFNRWDFTFCKHSYAVFDDQDMG